MIRVTDCPLRIVTEADWLLLDLAEFARKGLLPLPGGVLDQLAVTLDAIRFVWNEESSWKAVLMERSNG